VPPVRKFSKEEIIVSACNIIKTEGKESLNARRLATSLGCSVQPIFHNFTSMEDLNKEIYNHIYNKYKEYMFKAHQSKIKPYKEMGLAYIRFASDYPEFFKMIFMQQTSSTANNIIITDDINTDIIASGQELTHLSYEEQHEFHLKVWIFTHGIACLVATNTVKFTDEEIDKLLENTVLEMFKGYKLNKGESL